MYVKHCPETLLETSPPRVQLCTARYRDLVQNPEPTELIGKIHYFSETPSAAFLFFK